MGESKMSRRMIKRDCAEGGVYVFLRETNEY